MPTIDSEQPVTGPFLTVLVRTSGRRPDTLNDALASIAAQTERDLEVIVLVHSEVADDLVATEAIVADFDPRFARQVHVVPVASGSRGHPLNVGLARAAGRYVSFLDDDDVVLAHWVAEFRKAADQRPGHVLRASSADQPFERMTAYGGYLTQTGPTTLPRPARFDILQHLHHNESPICTLAFPIDELRAHGLCFDEELAVVEDWDLLARSMVVIGVESIAEVTSIYRRWPVDNSATLHSEAVWLNARNAVLAKLDLQTITLPAGEASRIAGAYDAPLGGDEDYWLLKARAADLTRQVAEQHHRLADAERRYAEISRSEWWRATAGPRRLGTVIKHLIRRPRRPVQHDGTTP